MSVSVYALKDDTRISENYTFEFEVPQKVGDIDGDGTITIIDVRLLLQIYINSDSSTEFTGEDARIYDIDSSTTLDIIDVRLLLQKYINS